MKWRYFLAFLLLSLVSLPVFSESETEFEVPELEPEAIYEMSGQDIMTLYQEINNLMELKNDFKNSALEMLELATNAETLAQEYENENQKLQIQNNFLVGGITISAGIIVTGVITLIVTNIK